MNRIASLSDTTPEIELLQYKLLAGLSMGERFQRMNRLCSFGKLIMLEGLREKNPQLSENELIILLAKNLWGQKFATYIETRIAHEKQ